MRILPGLRERSRGLAMLAVLGLLFQMIGAFGHTHLSHGTGATAAFAKPAPSAMAVSADVDASHKAHLPAGADHDALCAVCLAGALVAAAITASPPALVLPVAYLLLGPPQPGAAIASIIEHQAFWSRGPPLY